MTQPGLLLRGTALLLCLFISHAPSPCRAQATGTCISWERDALLSFKASLLDPAGHLSSWQGEECCLWKGIRCHNRTGHVVQLNLRNIDNTDTYDIDSTDANDYPGMSRKLSLSIGEMSSSLGTLQQLRYIDLSYNYFNFTSIPLFMGSLKNLRYLNLSGAGFGGRIPSQLGNISNLQYLDVSWNGYDLYAVDLAWLPRLSLLTHLDMAGLDLSSAQNWVHTVSMLPALKVLRLFDCHLSSTVSAISQSNLTHLEVLDLSTNFFSSSLKHNWFWDLTSLKELYLSSSGWYGSIPNELGNMTSLEVIDFSQNDLVAGLIPNNIEKLCNLKELQFQDNNINASIGEFMERLPRCSWNALQVLSVGGTNMTGKLPIWIGNMTNLSVLQASGNMLTGPLPLGIGALGKLKTLDLSDNIFSGVLFKEHFASLSNLEQLDLSYNKLNSVLMKEHFAGFSKLEDLDLSYNSLKLSMGPNWVPPFRLIFANFQSCQLGPHFPEWLRWQTDIDMLVLGNANLDDVIPDWFWVTFSQASILDVSGNALQGSLPANLQHMSAESIYLGSNKLTGQVPLFPINISRLNLSSNSFSGSLPSELKAPLLEELLLANNQITGTIPSSMCQLISLERLDLSGNKLIGDVMQCWEESDANLTNQFGSKMLSLALNNNDLSGEFPEFLQSASQLLFLDLSYNRFFGRLPRWLPEKMPQLRILSVRSNKFIGHVPKNLTCLYGLQYLDIACNNISGSIPWSLSNLKAMMTVTIIPADQRNYNFEESMAVIMKDQKRDYTYEIYKLLVNFDLSSNSLTGQIPEEISSLVRLTNLNLSGNQLTGRIPSQIADLKYLESLDLSYNEFSGPIPSSLSALTSLSHLNLSYNNLSGEIPSGPQLQALDNQMYIYIGNPGLCGPPLSRNCSTHDAAQGGPAAINHMAYLYLCTSIGFVMGLWTVFCTMLLKRTWRTAYFQIIDKLYDKVYVLVAVSWARLMEKTQDGAP